MRTVAIVVLYLTAILCVQTRAACTSPGDTTTRISHATYYGAYTNGGACSLDPTPYAGTNGVRTTVAIADNIWAGSAACGMCVNITGKGTGSGASASAVKGSFIAFVNNRCPSCEPSGIDLGLEGDGVWDITWKPVPCPVGSNKIQFLLQGTNLYYLKLQVRNTRYPVSEVSIIQSGTPRALKRTADNFWEAGSGVVYPLSSSFQVTIKATTGDVVTDTVPSISNGVVHQGLTQFLDCSGGSGSSASAATTSGKVATTTTTTTGKAATTTTTGKAATTTTTGKVATTAAAATTAKTSTTGSGSTTGTQSAVIVYDDEVKAPFQDWSWATVNKKVTAPVKEGQYSFGFIPVSDQAAYFSNVGGINSALYSVVEFFIYSPFAIPSGGDIAFALVRSGNPVGEASVSSYTGGSVSANTWTKGTVSFSAFSGTFDGLWFQDKTGKTGNPQVYLDSIRLIRK